MGTANRGTWGLSSHVLVKLPLMGHKRVLSISNLEHAWKQVVWGRSQREALVDKKLMLSRTGHGGSAGRVRQR